MTRSPVRRRLLALALAAALSGQALAQNFEAFTVSDIRVDGLQRISAGTVFSYLPVEKGDLVDRSRSSEAIRALFRTGFFSDVSLERQGDILVVKVVERPAINTLTLTGNKDIQTEELLKGLKGIGLAEGETFNPLNLDRVTQELTRQYNNRGKYNVSIAPKITPLDRNRVDVEIVIDEGKAAKIRDINIVGNESFPEQEIRDSWESSTTNWLSWYRRDDQYSREKLSGDLEKLQNFYLDRGYVDFNVESTQVQVSPSRQDMFITANVSEGEVYTISSVSVSGDTIVPQEEVEKLVLVKEGETFSRAKLEYTADAITLMLGNIGYAFAQVNPIPEVDREGKKVAINLFVEPGPRVQVRRIEFKGNAHTADEVMRREMRQFEASWYSQAAIDRSKIRLQRLGFFESVDIETPAVPGKPDQVDIIVNVKERNAGTFVFGLGYSQLGGLITSIQLQQNNFLGSGNRFTLGIQNNRYSKRFNFSYFDPYFTDDGVSLGYNLAYSDYDQGTNAAARYNAANASGEAVLGIPLSEHTSITTSLGIARNQITTQDGRTPAQLYDYLVDTMGDRAYLDPTFVDIDDDGDERIPNPNYDPTDPNSPPTLPAPCTQTNPVSCTPRTDDDGIPGEDPDTLIDPGTLRRWVVNTWSWQVGWARDTRNDYLLPTRGTYHRINAEIALPGSDLEYYRLSYDYEQYFPLTRWLVMKIGATVGYGDSYGSTRDKLCRNHEINGNVIAGSTQACGLPFFKAFYAGGPGSIRGFQANTVGPFNAVTTAILDYTDDGVSNPKEETIETDKWGDTAQYIGGPVKATGSFEFFFPKLFSGPGTRLSAFVDYGNVWADTHNLELRDMRISTGIALQWQSPLGPIQISYAIPIQSERYDQIEQLQFTFGQQ
jgi:outer membrane protein insertion porin family